MLLILSARSVNEDIALHYGHLPPSFLPLGNKRVFSWQADLAKGESVYMTVPEGYDISDYDLRAIQDADIKLIPQSPKKSLTEAIIDAVERTKPEGPLKLLYGDTLVRLPEGDLPDDFVVVQSTSANYPWAYVVDDGNGSDLFSDTPPQRIDTRQVVCGYYQFSDPQLLIEACRCGNIIEALNKYHSEQSLTRVEGSEWFDFGHLPLYFQSKKTIMINRVFNSLSYENHLLIKQSADTAKMRAEAHWYETIPASLQLNIPRYLGRVERNYRAGYAIEYLYHPLLSDLSAFGALPLTSWMEILNATFDFIDKCHAIEPEKGVPEASPEFADDFFEQMIVAKTWSRLEGYLSTAGKSADDRYTVNGQDFPPLKLVVERVINTIKRTTQSQIRFWHGDLFYGNIFYDFTARRILAIDPRGHLGHGEFSRYGDLRYDLAKLAHSVIGQYDKIILGRSRLTENSSNEWTLELSEEPFQPQVEEIFKTQLIERYGQDPDEILAMTALLFFSMLPLHSDRPDLQKMMLANGLRLSAQVDGVLR